MKKEVLEKFAGHFLAGCLDFAVGIFMVAVLSAWFRVEVPLWVYPLGSFLAVLPDMDILLPILRASDLLGWDHHQTFMHRPVLVLPAVAAIGAVVGLLLGSMSLYALIFFVCVSWHYVHDTKGFGGGGIAWFWPISQLYWGVRGGEVPEDVRTRNSPFYLEWIEPTALSARELFFAALLLTFAAAFDLQLVPWVEVVLPMFGIGILLTWTLLSSRQKN